MKSMGPFAVFGEKRKDPDICYRLGMIYLKLGVKMKARNTVVGLKQPAVFFLRKENAIKVYNTLEHGRYSIAMCRLRMPAVTGYLRSIRKTLYKQKPKRYGQPVRNKTL